ncbi:MAG: 2-succinyl-5-enolpyruvyl-6-hydroxy-3-cyclohexene-1-carboxylic-acid synthase [Solirubrobacteraceae bacterium]
MTASDTYLLLRALCDELARCGMRDACTSPGSRNTPLVLSLVREPRIRTWSHIDERCAGFFALGAAKAGGRPVAMTCTSGTAAANYAPAVIEAFHARVPLIVLTGDRPPELRDVGAGQAIDQLKLYGDAVKWFCEVGVDAATPESLRWIRRLACRAYWTSLDGRPGPVHLNFPLREPLVLDAPLAPDPVPGRAGGRPWLAATRAAPAPAAAPRALPERALPERALPERALPGRGIIVAGRDERGAGAATLGVAAARLAARAGYPLFADPLSGARRGPAAIPTYDLLLRDPGLTARLRPELVIRVGDLPTSKPLRTWLAALDGVEQVTLDGEAAWQDPAGVVSELVAGDPAATLGAWTAAAATASPTGAPDAGTWLASWRAADAAVTEAIEAELTADDDGLSEPSVARLLGEALGPDATLFVASSMPIRDIELYLPAGDDLPRVLSNRGANGIDGLVSTAFGVAAVSDGPVVLLIGDVALAHDLGGLLAARRLGLEITIVVLNNDGGGIFHFLPVSGQHDAFEEHIATPHGLRFEHAAALYGLRYAPARTARQLRDALGAAQLIEVHTDRAANLERHRRLADAGLRALGALSPTAPAASPAA